MMASAGNCSHDRSLSVFRIAHGTPAIQCAETEANTALPPRTRDHEIQNGTTSFQNERSLCLTHAHGGANGGGCRAVEPDRLVVTLSEVTVYELDVLRRTHSGFV
jgi:hypothetical protein